MVHLDEVTNYLPVAFFYGCQQAIVIPDYVTLYLSNNLNKTGKSFRF
ncbi:hypothetical protein HMPREF3212_00443 [Citrobacter freundii]|uniref:Uncharacterized protein n=1 Tax=uncultured Citrobacter sp. TaxID=200446 RepID=A0A212I9K2_9ENTR|nr:hypothetical protein AB07_4388 [Citrobacter freundii]KWZ93052.1 hypothetical protein HMPREF3212_00443 [Citrobacter freundii]SBV63483.1 hypothetical protein KM92CIT3_30114 [uncultured Citrobacter sp.]SBV69277.1 hypothetical protein KL86CIT2_680040 [uncultured Citrobacter sp.]